MKIDPPAGYTSWNVYIEEAVAVTPVDIDARRAFKRDIKLNQIAAIERAAGGITTSPSYRILHTYTSPGTYSPTEGHPWS